MFEDFCSCSWRSSNDWFIPIYRDKDRENINTTQYLKRVISINKD
ncbi:hypothetical protein HMPREF9136_1344 [Prevotella dentalis DSM 3688]|uniref:Uncharacterized protein n=1 Tax=Prevotella dentalis (strain ATCC 49559 / DSM 3688 / JCM 13448 / NCTC 12043 / ES 2772) TaxID=908937 RepID=F9D3B6_PREDD|nr:hypothetical protein HMPREF9136_1344 [Prevotella dentalis DSM 3688]